MQIYSEQIDKCVCVCFYISEGVTRTGPERREKRPTYEKRDLLMRKETY